MNEGKQKEAWELFKKKILEEAAKPGSNQSRVAERLGVHRTAISRWLSGRLKGERISVDDMRNYFDRLGLDPTPYFGDAAREAPQGVPLIGLAACGYDYWQKAIELPVTTTAAPPGTLPPDMFAVIATGDSLVPEGIREGMIAFCDPGAAPNG